MYLYFRKDRCALDHHESAVRSWEQTGLWLLGTDKLAQLKFLTTSPSETIPVCRQDLELPRKMLLGQGCMQGMMLERSCGHPLWSKWAVTTSKWRTVPDILIRDLGVAQVEPHDAFLSHAFCVQLEARSLLESRSNLSDQLPLRVRQPHHLQRQQDRGWLSQRREEHQAGLLTASLHQV